MPSPFGRAAQHPPSLLHLFLYRAKISISITYRARLVVKTVAMVGVGIAPIVSAGIQKKEVSRISKADFQGAKFILRSLEST